MAQHGTMQNANLSGGKVAATWQAPTTQNELFGKLQQVLNASGKLLQVKHHSNAYNLSAFRCKITAAGNASLGLKASPVAVFTLAYDYERCGIIIANEFSDGSARVKFYADMPHAADVIDKSIKAKSMIVMSAAMVRGWLASVRGIAAETTTREYLAKQGGGFALYADVATAIDAARNKPKRIASVSDSERATIH
jgi:hypothetical protein